MSTAQGERRLRLAATRSLLYSLPANELFELPGRPHVVYQLRTYANTGNVEDAAQQARNDSPFLFKAFETGQIGPKRLARMHDKPRIATIHEYLDWTVTAQAAEGDEDLDFDGFRVLVILPRYRSGWPPPGGDVAAVEEPRKQHVIGGPKGPIPILQTHGRPVTAATIRSGPGYLEIPFVATHENKRGRGYCRCLVEAIEEIARALGLKKLMLCSTNDESVKSTWQHLGFEFASDEQMEDWDILHTDLVYLQNTTQMHKDVPPRRRFKPVIIRHDTFKQRCYSFVGQKRSQRPPGSMAGLSMPANSRPRLSSRRSDSTSRDGSQSFAARELQLPLQSGLDTARASIQPPYGVTSPLAGLHAQNAVTPQAAASVSGRPTRRRLVDDAELASQGQAVAGRLEDEVMAGSGPPTPQPADAGGHARPLHALATIDIPSTSHTDLDRREAASAEQQQQPEAGAATAGLALDAGGPGSDTIAVAVIVEELPGAAATTGEADGVLHPLVPCSGVAAHGPVAGGGPWLPLPGVAPHALQQLAVDSARSHAAILAQQHGSNPAVAQSGQQPLSPPQGAADATTTGQAAGSATAAEGGLQGGATPGVGAEGSGSALPQGQHSGDSAAQSGGPGEPVAPLGAAQQPSGGNPEALHPDGAG